MHEPRNRNSALYTVKQSNISSTSKAIAEAKDRFCEATDYDKSEVRAKKIEESFIHNISDTVVTIVVTVRHRVYRQE